MGITASIGAVGLAGAGFLESHKGAKQQAAATAQQVAAEQAIEAQRQQAMELDARRKQLELVRNSQRARSLSLATATSQGAQFGSGLQGGYAQTAGQTGVNSLGISQNLGIGENIFGLNAQLSSAKLAYAQGSTSLNTGAGLTSLGGSLLNAAGTIGKIGQGFGGKGTA